MKRSLSSAVSLTLLLATLVFVLSLRANAQTLGTMAGTAQSLKIKTTGRMVAPRDVGNNGASVTTTSAEVEAVYELDKVSLTLTYDVTGYSWDKVGRLPFGDGRSAPWSTLQRIGLDIGYHGSIYRRWGYFIGGYGGFSFEQEINDAGNLAGYGGLTYALNDEWHLSLGAGVKYHRVETFPFPVVGINYISNSVKGLTAEIRFPYSSASYKFNEVIGVRVFGNYDYGMYKLRDDSPAERGGFLETRGYRAGAYVDIWPLKNARLSLGCEYNFAGDYTLYRSSGSRIKRYDRDGGPGGRLQFKMSF